MKKVMLMLMLMLVFMLVLLFTACTATDNTATEPNTATETEPNTATETVFYEYISESEVVVNNEPIEIKNGWFVRVKTGEAHTIRWSCSERLDEVTVKFMNMVYTFKKGDSIFGIAYIPDC